MSKWDSLLLSRVFPLVFPFSLCLVLFIGCCASSLCCIVVTALFMFSVFHHVKTRGSVACPAPNAIVPWRISAGLGQAPARSGSQELGVWGRIGCGGLAPTKHRQQERTSEITEELLQCFDLLRTIVATRPCKQLEVVPHADLRFLADVPPRRYQDRAQGAS